MERKEIIKDTALSVDSVSKVVQSGQQELEILHDISFKLERGKSMAVVGPSGCGKSTLLNIIAGLDVPTEGDVSFIISFLSTIYAKTPKNENYQTVY